jgi:hypothetical protein
MRVRCLRKHESKQIGELRLGLPGPTGVPRVDSGRIREQVLHETRAFNERAEQHRRCKQIRLPNELSNAERQTNTLRNYLSRTALKWRQISAESPWPNGDVNLHRARNR